LNEDLNWKEVERLKQEWDIVLQGGKIRENNRTGQWKIIGLLPVVETLVGKDGMEMNFACQRCNAYLLGYRRTTREEEAAFNLSQVPDYSGGWLVAPLRIKGRLTTRPFRCSCAVGRSLPARIPFYDAQPEADSRATQVDLTLLEWKLREQESNTVGEYPEGREIERRVFSSHSSESTGAQALQVGA
jgi:hypothetical protein